MTIFINGKYKIINIFNNIINNSEEKNILIYIKIDALLIYSII